MFNDELGNEDSDLVFRVIALSLQDIVNQR